MVELERLYAEYRPLLFSLAYRLLGSVSDAEDMVQDTFVAAHAHTSGLAEEGSRIENWKAYLCRAVTNRCFDLLKSARRKRERYVGPWLPEPIVHSLESAASGEGGLDDPLEATLLGETMSYAFVVLLSRLTPLERAVFVLREAFGFSYREIAVMIGKTELGCRQTHSRVRRKIQAEPSAMPEAAAEADSLMKKFLQAAATGDIQELISALTEDAMLVTDGGGKLRAALNPIVGRKRIAAFLSGLAAKMSEQTEARAILVNGALGLLLLAPDGPTVVSIESDGNGRCSRIYMVRNPDKLSKLRGV
jgi:RNA polymerase sigma-70 factor (ECF subfamily)